MSAPRKPRPTADVSRAQIDALIGRIVALAYKQNTEWEPSQELLRELELLRKVSENLSNITLGPMTDKERSELKGLRRQKQQWEGASDAELRARRKLLIATIEQDERARGIIKKGRPRAQQTNERIRLAAQCKAQGISVRTTAKRLFPTLPMNQAYDRTRAFFKDYRREINCAVTV